MAENVEANQMLMLRDELDRRYKPYFDQFKDAGGIPFRDLRDKLIEQGVTDHMPEGKIDILLQKADTDGDQNLDYDEFVELMTNPKHPFMSQRKLTIFQQITRTAVSSVVPNRAKQQGQYVVDDYISQYNCKPPPLFIIFISLIELGIFIYYAVQLKDDPTYKVTATSGCPMGSPFIYNPSRRYEAWRFLTYMFIHNGYLHIIFNLIFQLLIGIPLEMVHKWWRLGIVYALGVIAGSMCHSVFDTHTMLAGASGGCYALIGAHFAIVIMNWKEMTHDWMDGPIKFIMSAPVRLVFWTLFAGIDTGLAIWKRYTGEADTNIGYAAHFGGALAGLLIGIPVLKNIDVKPWEKVVWALLAQSMATTFPYLLSNGLAKGDSRRLRSQRPRYIRIVGT